MARPGAGASAGATGLKYETEVTDYVRQRGLGRTPVREQRSLTESPGRGAGIKTGTVTPGSVSDRDCPREPVPTHRDAVPPSRKPPNENTPKR